ncbi:MAG: CDF family Co(II)/Ni(II) efflux transporter DmeF [Rhizomicrobium sp.]
MHADTIEDFRHEHVFLGASHGRNEHRTWIVIGVCGAMMLVEIIGGMLFGSMALIADGLHMSTHAGALLIAAAAYTMARRYAGDGRFSLGTGKFGELAGYTSALVLAMIALLIGYESLQRLFHPIGIAFDQALPVAGLGLCVNILSAWLLRDDHDHADEDHGHDHHHDLNLRAAYIHVLADAAISVLAVIGLLAGRQLGWIWMDPVMGIVGACVIANWSWGLIRAASGVLVDMSGNATLKELIRTRLEVDGDRLADLHIWRIGPGHNAVIASVVTHELLPAAAYKSKLSGIAGLSHITIEVDCCPGAHPMAKAA